MNYNYVEQGNGLGQVQSIAHSNGITSNYTYDGLGRIQTEQEVIDGQTYQSGYAYDNQGNLSEMTYPSGFSLKNYYNLGYLTEQRRGDNNATLYDQPAYNVRGQLTGFDYGNGLSTLLDYDDYGFPEMFQVESGGTLNLNYDFNPGTGNLNWRNDHTYRLNLLNESFAYDVNELCNRLTGWGEDNQQQYSLLLSGNGNILGKTDITANSPNSYQYTSSRPHAVTKVDNTTQDYQDFVDGQNQEIEYNAIDKTASIEQGNKRLEFVYGPDQSRKIMKTFEWENNAWVLKKSKYYILGNTEIEVDEVTNETRTLNYIGGKAILEQTSSEDHLYYLHKDYQGTTLAVTDEDGVVVQRYAYDPWGRRRNPTTWANLSAAEIAQQNFLFDRGYTGHEHLDEFGLINMNGRMYDPLLGRMLSPDNYVQAPDNSQNFNRYSYAMNNPLVYTDPSGECIIPAIMIGAFINVVMQGWSGNAQTVGDFALAFGIGGLSGAAGGGLGELGATITNVSGFIGGAVSGGLGGFGGGFVSGAGNAWAQGSSFIDGYQSGLKNGASGALSGAIIGGTISGISAKANGYDFWDGSKISATEAIPITQKGIETGINNSVDLSNYTFQNFEGSNEYVQSVVLGDESLARFPSDEYRFIDGNIFTNDVSLAPIGGITKSFYGKTSMIWISKDYTSYTGDLIPTLGHEVIHSYHNVIGFFSSYGTNASEFLAHRYSAMILPNTHANSSIYYMNEYLRVLNQIPPYPWTDFYPPWVPTRISH